MRGDELRNRTKQFALLVIKFTRTLPADFATQVIAKQLVRAGTSVGANYRAACLAKSTADMISKLKIVEEEADECGYWLELLAESGSVSSDSISPIQKEADEILKIMIASIKTLRH